MAKRSWEDIEEALWQACKIVLIIAVIVLLTTGCADVRDFFEKPVYEPDWLDSSRRGYSPPEPIPYDTINGQFIRQPQGCCQLPPLRLEPPEIEVVPQRGGPIT